MSEVLALNFAGPKGVWARIRLDSGEVVFVSVASDTTRVRAMKTRGLFRRSSPTDILYEITTADAYLKYSAAPTDLPPGAIDSPDKRTADFLSWLVAAVTATPNIAALQVALPQLIGAAT